MCTTWRGLAAVLAFVPGTAWSSLYIQLDKQQCAQKGGVWSKSNQLEPPGNYCLFVKEKRACEARGGEWVPFRRMDFTCRLKSRDGGRPCKDSSECKFGCEPRRGQPELVGTCAPDDDPFRCKLFRHEGKAGTICVR